MAMDPTNEKKVSSSYIPDAIVFSILSKLPIKSLKMFSCARKSWHLLFENPNFIKIFRDNLISKFHPLYDDARLILNQVGSPDYLWNFYLLYGASYENKVKLDLPPPFHIQENGATNIRILGSAINGTLCIYFCDRHPKVVLWNPATDEFKVIPPSLGELSPKHMTNLSLHGFGYDHVGDDYKIIQHVFYISFNDYSKSFFELYSLKSNSWKKHNFDMPTRYLNTNYEVYLNGVCHWMEETISVRNVVSFDLSNEMFYTTLLPLDDVHDDFDVNLTVLYGSVAIISNYKNTMSFQISILGEFGVNESWIRLFNAEPFSCIGHPIGTGKNGNIFIKKEDGELACFDLTTGMTEEIGIKGERFFWCQMVIYEENLHPICEINN